MSGVNALKVSNVHSHEQRQGIRNAARALLRGSVTNEPMAYLVMAEAVKHGLEEFDELEAYLASCGTPSRRRETHHAAMRAEYAKVREIRQSVPATLLGKMEEQLLTPFKPTHIPGPNKDAETVVIFLTAFNNFYLSNVVVALMLLERGYSVLFLQSARLSQFLNGVPGFGRDWGSSMRALETFLNGKSGGALQSF